MTSVVNAGRRVLFIYLRHLWSVDAESGRWSTASKDGLQQDSFIFHFAYKKLPRQLKRLDVVDLASPIRDCETAPLGALAQGLPQGSRSEERQLQWPCSCPLLLKQGPASLYLALRREDVRSHADRSSWEAPAV